MSLNQAPPKRPPLPKPVQQAILNLIAWNSDKRLLDHGYDVSADLRTLLQWFQVRISEPESEST